MNESWSKTKEEKPEKILDRLFFELSGVMNLYFLASGFALHLAAGIFTCFLLVKALRRFLGE